MLYPQRSAIHLSSTCTEYVHSDLPLDASAAAKPSSAEDDGRMLAALRQKEEELLRELAVVGASIDAAEEDAHGVVRCDPRQPATDDPADTVAALKARAHARVEEWAAVLGGGRVTLSQALTLPKQTAAAGGGLPECECRREVWVVQLYAKTRRVQVAAARLSCLPPDGSTCQFIDVTWLDAVGGTDGVHHGLPRLAALLASVGTDGDEYDVAALSEAVARLSLPPLEHAHLASQPLLRANGDPCAALSRLMAGVGAEMAAWARLEEPLPSVDGAIEAIHFARLQPPTSSGARADLAMKWWARLDVYLVSAMLAPQTQTTNQQTADLGLRVWLANANASLRAHAAPAAAAEAEMDQRTGAPAKPRPPPLPDATTPLLLVLRIHRHAHADDERRA